MKKPTNMEIKIDNNELSMEWTYSITCSKHKTDIKNYTTQYITILNKVIIKLANIGKVLFMYKDYKTGIFYLTTKEPLGNPEYVLIPIRRNDKQRTIQLPENLLNLKENIKQRAKIRFYPNQKDPETQCTPKITLEVEDYKEITAEPKISVIDNKIYAHWEIDPNEKISDDLKELLSFEEIEYINNSDKVIDVYVNIEKGDKKIMENII